MYSKFLNLSSEKQDRILNAAINEFAQKGYDNASTNEIVKRAEISKGILFHYFKNKKQLFLFVYDFCVDECMEEYYKNMDFEEKDIINRLHKSLLIKMQLLNKYPDMFDFFQVAMTETSTEIKDDIEERKLEFIKAAYGKLLEGIDTSLFRDDIDIMKAINIISWTFDGYSNSVLKQTKGLRPAEIDYTEFVKEADSYIELIKKGIYK